MNRWIDEKCMITRRYDHKMCRIHWWWSGVLNILAYTIYFCVPDNPTWSTRSFYSLYKLHISMSLAFSWNVIWGGLLCVNLSPTNYISKRQWPDISPNCPHQLTACKKVPHGDWAPRILVPFQHLGQVHVVVPYIVNERLRHNMHPLYKMLVDNHGWLGALHAKL